MVDAVPGRPRLAYLGMFALLFIPLSWLSRHERLRTFTLWLLALFGLAVSMSVYTPVYELYRTLPGGSWFRAPPRILFLTRPRDRS